MARRTPPPAPLPSPEDVLAGRVRVNIETLVRLIHAVNPTDLDLPSPEIKARYASKSALQALLIQKFPDSLQPVPDPHDPDIVSLRLRGGNLDAGHAKVSALEPQARAWVHQNLEIEDEPIVSKEPGRLRTAADPETRGGADLLSAARQAIEEYDYESARALLTQALQTGQGGVDTAIELLELLVDTLALYEDCVALETTLPARALRTSRVSGALAIAHANLGNEARSLDCLQACLDPARSAEVLAVLATRAADAADTARLARHLHALRERLPSHPAILPLADRLQSLTAVSVKPEEDALEALVSRGEHDQAESAAQALLSRHPSSVVARRIRREAQERKDRETRRLLVERVQGSVSAGDLQRAQELLSSAPAEWRDDPELAELRACVRALWKAAERVQQVSEVQRLHAVNRRDGLIAWLGLDAGHPELIEDPAIELLRSLKGQIPSRRHAELVDACLALEEAARALQAADHQRALDLIRAHGETASRLQGARELADRALSGVLGQRLDRFQSLRAQARALLGSGDPERALALLEGADTTGLGDSIQSALASLREQARQDSGRKLFEARWNARMNRDDLLAARDLAASLLDQGEPWVSRLREVRARIRQRWCVRVLPGEVAWSDLRDRPSIMNQFGPDLHVRENGREVWLVDCRASLVVIRRVDVASSRVLEICLLRTPEPFEGIPNTQEEDNTLWILWTTHVLTIDVKTWEILSLRPLQPCIDEHERVTDAVLAIGTAQVWLVAENPEQKRRLLCLRTRSATGAMISADQPWILEQVHKDHDEIAPIPGHHPGSVMSYRHDNGHCVMFNATLKKPWFRFPCSTLMDIQVSSDRECLIINARPPGKASGSPLLWWGSLRAGQQDSCRIGDTPLRTARFATSHRGGLTYVVGKRESGEATLFAFDITGSEPFLRWQAPIPVESRLLQQPASREVVLLVEGVWGTRLLALDKSPPEFSSEELAALDQFWSFEIEQPENASVPTIALAALGAMLGQGLGLPTSSNEVTTDPLDDASRSWLDSVWPSVQGDVEQIATLLAWLFLRGRHKLARTLHERLDKTPGIMRQKGAGPLALERARIAWRSREWARVVELLGDLDLSSEHPHNAEYMTHMLALSWFRLGSPEKAIELLRRRDSTDVQDTKQLRWIQAIIDGPSPDENEPVTQENCVIPHIRAILRADASLRDGRPWDAIQALDTTFSWNLAELQGIARLAEAWLSVEPRTTREAYRSLLSLATLVNWTRNPATRHDIKLSSSTWDEPRLKDLCARAEERFERMIADDALWESSTGR